MKVYWITWIFSLLVTTCNGILTLFRVDKKYFLLNTTVEQLQSEITQYIHLSGRYAGFYTPNTTPSHGNQFVFLCHNIEKIKLKQVSEEYYKQMENSEEQSKQPEKSKTVAGMFQPTPTQQQLLEHRAELARALMETSQPKNQLIHLPQVDGADNQEENQNTDESQKVPQIQGRPSTAPPTPMPM